MNSAITISLLNLVFIGATMFLLPYLTPRRFFFMVTVSPGFPASQTGRSIMRGYHWQVTALFAASLLAMLTFRGEALAGAELLLGLGGGVALLYARNQVSRYSAAPETLREAELSPAPEHLPRWMLWALPPFLFPPAAAAWLHAHWDQIPERFPYHWGISGQADAWAVKSERAVYGPLLFCAATMLLMLLMSLAAFYGSRRSEQRLATMKLVIAAMYCLSLIFIGVALLPVINIPIWFCVAPTALFVIGAMVWQYKFLNAPGRRVEDTPDDCWYLGWIYYNPHDAAIFVQKRLGLGYTVNFGNRISWVLMAVVLVAMGGMVFLLPSS